MNMSETRLKYFEEQEKILSKVSKEYSSTLVGSKRERFFSDLIYTSCKLGERETQIIKIINSLATKEAQLANKGKAKEKKLELKEEHIRNFKLKVIESLLKDIDEPVEANNEGTNEPVEEPKNEPHEEPVETVNNDNTKEPHEEPVETVNNDNTKEHIEEPVDIKVDNTKEHIEEPVDIKVDNTKERIEEAVKTNSDGTIREKGRSMIDYNLNTAYRWMKKLDIDLPKSKEKFKELVKDCKFYMRDIENWRFNVNNKNWNCTPVVVAKKEDYYKGIKNTTLYKNRDVQNLVKKLEGRKEIIDAFEKVGCFLYGGGGDLSSGIILSNMKTNEAYVEMTKKYNKDYNTREELLIDLLKNIE